MRLPKFLLATSLACLLAACGGGGGGGGETPPPALAANATLTYTASNAPAYAYDPWTPITVTPTVSGLPAGTALTFSGGGVEGLGIAMGTGIITGRVLNDEQLGTRSTFRVQLTAAGYSGAIDTTVPINVHGLSFFLTAGGGFAVTGASQVTGTVGAAGTFQAKLGMDVLEPNGVLIAQPLPAGVALTYAFDAGGTPTPGATLDAATGVFTWTPPAPGTYNVAIRADGVANGIVRTKRTTVVVIVN